MKKVYRDIKAKTEEEWYDEKSYNMDLDRQNTLKYATFKRVLIPMIRKIIPNKITKLIVLTP